MSDLLRYEYQNSLSKQIGPEHGVSEEELAQFAPKSISLLKKIRREKRQGEHAFLDLPYAKETMENIHRFVEVQRGGFRELVVLGIGGSALGTSALSQALTPLFHQPTAESPRLWVLDNIDPEYFSRFLDQIDWEQTLFLVISKSGSTMETMAQFQIIRQRLQAAIRNKHKERIVLVTDPEKGSLRAIAKQEGFPVFDVPPAVGGRFSVLSSVGLLPAALLGLDIRALVSGAAAMDERCKSVEFGENLVAQFAAIQFLLHKKRKKNLFVSFCYSDRLRGFAQWWAQLCGESLGKRLDLKGREVFTGPTPVSAIGATDQHSQLQLYVEGPNDKSIIFWKLEQASADVAIPKEFAQFEPASWLGGLSLSKLLEAERAGVEHSLTAQHRPNACLVFPKISPHTIGQFILFKELAVALLGKMYRINPYDQPGVEEGKVAAKRVLVGTSQTS